MKSQAENPFETIESAHHFLTLLSEAVEEARREVESDLQRESEPDVRRRVDALRLAVYNLEKLEMHMNRSSRILNDLRTLRRLLFEERKGGSTGPQPVTQEENAA
jgi:hypothetical protein